jgi:hypothetical protein
VEVDWACTTDLDVIGDKMDLDVAVCLVAYDGHWLEVEDGMLSVAAVQDELELELEVVEQECGMLLS